MLLGGMSQVQQGAVLASQDLYFVITSRSLYSVRV